MERTLQDLVTEREELHKKMIAMGIPEAKVPEVVALLDDYQGLLHDVEEARRRQFADDAYILTTETKSNNKIPSIAEFLRRFAEHIATQTLMQTAGRTDHVSVASLVDTIQPMTPPDEEQHN